MLAHLARRLRPQGFTLIEMVITLVLLGMLGLVGTHMVSGSFFTNQVIGNEQLTYAGARYALERMGRDIREMQLTTGNAMAITTPTASNMSASKLSFTQTGLSGTRLVTLTFSAAVPGSISLAYDNGTAEDLVQNLSNAAGVFTYLQADGTTPSTDPATLHFVGIELRVKPDNTQLQVLTLSHLVALRNR